MLEAQKKAIKINSNMTKFKELVEDPIDKQSLSQIYGGNDDDTEDRDEHACEQQACSNNIEVLKDLCSKGVCESHAG